MDEFTAMEFANLLGTSLLSILPWVGAGAAAGIVLMLAFLGIRAGIRFFRSTSDSYDSGVGSSASDADHDYWVKSFELAAEDPEMSEADAMQYAHDRLADKRMLDAL